MAEDLKNASDREVPKDLVRMNRRQRAVVSRQASIATSCQVPYSLARADLVLHVPGDACVVRRRLLVELNAPIRETSSPDRCTGDFSLSGAAQAASSEWML